VAGKQLTIVRQVLAVFVILAGVACAVLGVAWKLVVPAHAYWSPTQAQEFNEASVSLKSVATRPDRRASQADDPELDAAQARFDRVQSDLERAIARRDNSGILFIVGGGVLFLCGVTLLVRARSLPADR
jgi:uncharacterized membrane protein YidH (DUF202 family)